MTKVRCCLPVNESCHEKAYFKTIGTRKMQISLSNCFLQNRKTWGQGYKTFFMLNSAELEVYPAHKQLLAF